MKGKKRVVFIAVWVLLLIASLVSSLLIKSGGEKESIKAEMRDAVLHETGKVSLFGLINVNPALISAITVTCVLLFAALIIRIFVIPRFTLVPNKAQLVLEEAVGYFDNLAKTNSPQMNKLLGGYVFAAGAYIFFGTLFELFGFQAMGINGASLSLPAPLADINGAISLGCFSYLFILSGGIAGNGIKGAGSTLKEFSLPISMSFRLFGALLSGLLVTDLVYYYLNLSFVLPVAVGIMFTLLHALIQTYVLTMLTALFYGEVSHKKPNKKKEVLS